MVYIDGQHAARIADGFPVALKRSKGQYDGACQELESKRKKTDSGFDSMYGRKVALLSEREC